MKLISPSKLAVAAAGFSPVGVPSSESGTCLMCGFEFTAGSPVVDANLPTTFTSWSDLAAPSSDKICGHCATISQDPWTQAWMNSVICEEGVFKFASNNDIAFWLLEPPKGPFVMTRGDQQKQHLVWRTPVNYSREIFQVRIGEKVVAIRRKHLVAARDAALALSAIQAEEAEKSGVKKRGVKAASSFINPFIAVSREMDNPLAGRVKESVLKLACENPEVASHVAVLRQCTPGEIWGLTAVLYATPIEAGTKQVLKS